jgi:diguanylate cyclase (GGDEF)-like protein/PAS domain S-box-containing protein
MSEARSAQKAIAPYCGDNANIEFTATSLVNAIPCPAVMVWPDGRIISSNQYASVLVAENAEGGFDLRSDLLPQVAVIARNGCSENWIIRLKKRSQPGSAAMSHSLTGIAIPLAGKKTPAVLIYGADSALERNLRKALIESRTFYQDLANCSSDFTWSTDTRGVFTFINQKGVAGYQADFIHGKPALELLASRTERRQAEAVFQTRAPVSEKEIWLKGAKGDDCCFMISALPVYGTDGKWTGARGVGRDVTELRAREAELRRAQRSEKLINTVLGIIRNEVDPSKMLTTAAAAVIDAIGMTSCWIFQRKYGEDFSGQTASVFNIVPRSSMGMKNAPTTVEMRAIAEKNLKNPEANIGVFTKNGWSFLVAKTKYAGQINGALCFVRQIGEENAEKRASLHWNAYEHSMITSVANQLSVVIAQSEHQEELKVLSQTDGLTGLMNRRSFLPETARRLAHHARQNRKAAFLYIDLDNFKGINDNDGHARGDQILKAVSELIQANSRTSDLSARFGGDEFVLWLEEADESIAILKANDLIDGCQDIVAIAKDTPGSEFSSTPSGEMSFEHLGMSIGISIYIPGTKETIDQLIARADEALYVAKKGGKGGYRVAGAATPEALDQPDQKDVGGSGNER